MSFATAAPAQRSTRQKPKKHALRRDIQGLRAFAVLAVFADHVLGWPEGGFIGVDIFFVISGFLITGILLREYSSSGSISFTGFYARRTRRIIPAALVTIAVTIAASYVIFPASKASNIFWDGLASALFVGNWRFAATGTDYFAQGAPSPLQNFWSLAVEEQFYFVWPWLMLAVLLIGTRLIRGSARAATFVAGALMAVLVAASFGWAMLESVASPTVAYFSTITRVWELGVGALLAIFGGLFGRLPMVARIAMSWAGFAVMAMALFVITPDMPFPAPWALMPVLGSVLVIAAGIGQEPKGVFVLTNPAARYFGDMSYSLYLWHWPVIILATALYPDGGVWLLIGATLFGVGISVLSYEVIEKPFNESPLLRSYPHRRLRQRAWEEWSGHSLGRLVRVAAGVLVASAVTLTLVAVLAPPGANADSAPREARTEFSFGGTPAATEAATDLDSIADGVSHAVDAQQWPGSLTPSIDTVEIEGMPVEYADDCSNPSVDATSCTYGTSGSQILVYGDSLAGTLLPTIRAAYEDDHRIRGLSMGACAVTDLDVTFNSAETEADCMTHREAVINYVTANEPEIVFLIQNYEWARQLTSGAQGPALRAEWAEATQDLNDRILDAGAGTVVWVSPPPVGESIIDCATVTATPATCQTPIPDYWLNVHKAETSLPITYLDETDWFCADSICPVINEDTIIRRDAVHPTRQYAEKIAPLWRERADSLLESAR